MLAPSAPLNIADMTWQQVLALHGTHTKKQAATKAGTLLTRPGTGLVESEYVRAVKLGHRAGRQAREEQDDLVSHPLWRLTCGALTAGLYIAHRVAGALQPSAKESFDARPTLRSHRPCCGVKESFVRTGNAAAPAGASNPQHPAYPLSGAATADRDQPTQATMAHNNQAVPAGERPQLTEQEAKVVAAARSLKEQGNAAYKAKKYSEAFAFYHASTELWDRDVAVVTNMAAVMFQLGNFSDCVDFCDIALTRGPGLEAAPQLLARAATRKGKALVEMGRTHEAVEAFQRSMDMQCTAVVFGGVLRWLPTVGRTGSECFFCSSMSEDADKLLLALHRRLSDCPAQVTVQAGGRWTAQVTAAIQALRVSTGRWQPWCSRETDCNPWVDVLEEDATAGSRTTLGLWRPASLQSRTAISQSATSDTTAQSNGAASQHQ